MAGTLYVSNPRRRRSRKAGRKAARRSNPMSEAKLKALAKDLQRISAGSPPLSAVERRAEALQEQVAELQARAGNQAAFANLVKAARTPAALKAAQEAAESEVRRELRKVLGKGVVGKKSRRRRGRKAGGYRRVSSTALVRRSNPFYGALELANPRRRKRGAKRRTYRMSRNSKGQFRRKGSSRRRNPLSISNPMAGIPILGTALGMIGPAFFGGVGVEAIGQVGKLVASRVAIPEMIAPYQYTIGGLALSGVFQLLTFIPAPIRLALSTATASAGAGVDWYRYRSGQGAYGDLELGDGGNWSVEYGDLELGDDNDDFDFGDLELGDDDDLAYAGVDFDVDEGRTLVNEGYSGFAGKFVRRGQHPGARGRRWIPLARRVGKRDFRRLAMLPPAERIATIQAIKAEAAAESGNAPAQKLLPMHPPMPSQYAQKGHADADPYQSQIYGF